MTRRAETFRIQTSAAAEILGVTPRTVQNLAVRGELPGAAKIGKVWTFDRTKLARHIANQEAQCQRKTYSSGAKSGGCEPPSRAASSEKAYEQAMSKLRGV